MRIIEKDVYWFLGSHQRWPSHLDELAAYIGEGPYKCRCRNDGAPTEHDCFYYRAQGAESCADPNELLACELAPRHGGKRIVLFVDGELVKVDEERFRTLLADPLNAGSRNAMSMADRNLGADANGMTSETRGEAGTRPNGIKIGRNSCVINALQSRRWRATPPPANPIVLEEPLKMLGFLVRPAEGPTRGRCPPRTALPHNLLCINNVLLISMSFGRVPSFLVPSFLLVFPRPGSQPRRSWSSASTRATSRAIVWTWPAWCCKPPPTHDTPAAGLVGEFVEELRKRPRDPATPSREAFLLPNSAFPW